MERSWQNTHLRGPSGQDREAISHITGYEWSDIMTEPRVQTSVCSPNPDSSSQFDPRFHSDVVTDSTQSSGYSDRLLVTGHRGVGI